MATLQEIADAAGVTNVTVSRVLTGSYVAKRPDALKRAQRIRRLADQLGYRPSNAARATRTGRTGCIGMLVSPHYRNSVHDPGFEYAVIDTLAQHNLNLLKGRLEEPDADGQVATPRLIAEHLADGLIINFAFKIDPAAQAMLDRTGMPALWINAKLDRNCIHPDDARAGRIATQRLLELGHRRIAFASPGLLYPADLANVHYSEIDRHGAYIRAMRDAGLQPLALRPGELHDEDEFQGHAVRRLAEFLRQTRPSAVIVNAPPGVAMHGARAAGLRVPEDLSLIAFSHDTGVAEAHAARMTVPFREMGRRAAEHIAVTIEDPAEGRDPIVLPYDLIEGPTLRRLP